MDLRTAVQTACAIGAYFTPPEVAILAGVPENRALAYSRLLVKQGVLIEGEDQRFDRGPQFKCWSRKRAERNGPSTYGNNAAYQRQKAVRDAWRQRAWQLGRGKEPRVVSRPIRKRPEVPLSAIGKELAAFRFRSTARACTILQVSKRTLYSMVKAGQLKVYRFGMRKLSFDEKDLIAYVAQRSIQAAG